MNPLVARSPEFDDPSDFQVVSELLKGTWPVVLAIVIIISASTAAYLLLRIPLFRSEALITVQPQGFDALSKDGNPPSNETVRSEMDVIKSSATIARVASKLRLDADPEFHSNSGVTALSAGGDLVENVAKRLEVENDGRSFSIKVAFRSNDRERAAKIANAFADEAVASQRSNKIASVEAVRSGMLQSLSGLRTAAETAEARADAFRRKNKLVIIDAAPFDEQGRQGGTVAARQASELARTQADLRGRRFQAIAQWQQSKALSDIGGSPTALSSPIVQSLRAQEAELMRTTAAMRLRRGPDHRDVVQLEVQLRSVRAALAAELARILQSLTLEARAAASSEQAAANTISKLQSQVGRELSAQSRYRTMLGEARQQRSLYEDFAAQIAKATERASAQLPDLIVVSRAVPSRRAIGPSAVVVISLAVLAMIVVGLLASIARGLTRPRFASIAQVGRVAGLPALSVADAQHDPELFAVGRRLIAEAQRRAGPESPAVLCVVRLGQHRGQASLVLPWALAIVQQGMSVGVLDRSSGELAPNHKARILDFEAMRNATRLAIDMTALAEQFRASTRDLALVLVETFADDEQVAELGASISPSLLVFAVERDISRRAFRRGVTALASRGVVADAVVVSPDH